MTQTWWDFTDPRPLVRCLSEPFTGCLCWLYQPGADNDEDYDSEDDTGLEELREAFLRGEFNSFENDLGMPFADGTTTSSAFVSGPTNRH